jgi:hypothetical protein
LNEPVVEPLEAHGVSTVVVALDEWIERVAEPGPDDVLGTLMVVGRAGAWPGSSRIALRR